FTSAINNVQSTWEFDGVDWTPMSTGVGPAAREGSAMVFDAVRNRTLLFGGLAPWGPASDAWEWDGATWTFRGSAHAPTPRYRHCMAFDEARGRTVLFGGTSGSALYDDTWEWDGVDWTMASPPAHPSARIYHAMAYDRQRARAVLVGGTATTTMFADTWRWDGTSWLLAAGNALDPQPQGSNLWQPDLAYDGTRQQCVLARGHATWTWDNVHWRRAPLAVGEIDAAVPAYDHLHDQ